jgi:lipopolysaccharide transport system ATP-binding protein
MSDVVIRAEGLSKQYRLGQREPYYTLRDTLARAMNGLRTRWKKPRDRKTADTTFWALRDVTFEVRRGEVVGVIGRNGAGKSTLLKILSRIIEPTAGWAELRGRVGSLLEVGTGFHPELTGRENIFLAGTILGMKRAEIRKKFDEIVQFAEIDRFLDTPVKHYSSGMYMRLGFAVAAHLDSGILLIDEILAVGDFAFQKKCLGKIGTVASEGRAILFVTHHMNAVERLCQKLLWLDSGRIAAFTDDIKDSLRRYMVGTGDPDSASEWINPGNEFRSEWFFPRRFAITDRTGRVHRMPVPNNEDLWLHVEIDVAEPDPALNIGYALYSQEGELLYWSCHTDGAETSWPQVRKGRNSLMAKLPARILNEGTYRIELFGALHFRQWLVAPGTQAPSILLRIQGGLSDSSMFVVRRPGLLAPIMEWESFAEAA